MFDLNLKEVNGSNIDSSALTASLPGNSHRHKDDIVGDHLIH
jgi:hypothetical protein